MLPRRNRSWRKSPEQPRSSCPIHEVARFDGRTVAKDLGDTWLSRPKLRAGRIGVRISSGPRRRFAAPISAFRQSVAPRNEVERKLSAIWQEVFGIDVVGVTDDFFELGGDLLDATTLAAEIEATFGRRFTPADLITLSTIAQQADWSMMQRMPPQSCRPVLSWAVPAVRKRRCSWCMAAKGFAFFGPAFFDIVGENRSVYLFQAPVSMAARRSKASMTS